MSYTASFLDFYQFNMKPSYLAATTQERPYSFNEPLDFGSIDAPAISPAGSVVSHEYSTIPGQFTPMKTTVSRPY